MNEPRDYHLREEDEDIEPSAARGKIKQSDEALAMLFGLTVSGLLEAGFPFDVLDLLNVDDEWF